jgi:putative endonuclease
MSFQYVYLLESEQTGHHHYVGLTDDLKARLAKHNQGEVPHTSKSRPWSLKVAVAFHDREKAAAFERYLKSHSGRAFAKRHC